MKMLALILAVIIGIGSVYWFGSYNPLEEVAEEIIEKKAGIDLTPSSKETGK